MTRSKKISIYLILPLLIQIILILNLYVSYQTQYLYYYIWINAWFYLIAAVLFYYRGFAKKASLLLSGEKKFWHYNKLGGLLFESYRSIWELLIIYVVLKLIFDKYIVIVPFLWGSVVLGAITSLGIYRYNNEPVVLDEIKRRSEILDIPRTIIPLPHPKEGIWWIWGAGVGFVWGLISIFILMNTYSPETGINLGYFSSKNGRIYLLPLAFPALVFWIFLSNLARIIGYSELPSIYFLIIPVLITLVCSLIGLRIDKYRIRRSSK